MSTGATERRRRAPRARPTGAGVPARREQRASRATGDRAEAWREARLARSRFGIVYDVHGPRVRLGVVWFVVALGALYLGTWALAALVGGVAAVAALQASRELRAPWRTPHRVVAAGFGVALPLAAAAGTGLAGAVTLVLTAAAVVVAATRPSRGGPLVDAGATVRAGLFVGLAAASVVLLAREEIGAAVTLVLLVSAYEVGDFLVGSGAANVIEGPAAGFVSVGVATAWMALVQPPPFQGGVVWVYGALVVLLAPVGQVLASAILPRAGAPAPALRRLDSYLVTAPVWLVAVWSGLTG